MTLSFLVMCQRMRMQKIYKKYSKNLSTLYDWSTEWSMLFNAEKCKCIHHGYNNKHYDYFMGNECIETTHGERDLGVIITETLDVTKQCVRAANKANAMLAMINRAFKYKTKEVVLKLYKSLVRPPPALLHSGMAPV